MTLVTAGRVKSLLWFILRTYQGQFPVNQDVLNKLNAKQRHIDDTALEMSSYLLVTTLTVEICNRKRKKTVTRQLKVKKKFFLLGTEIVITLVEHFKCLGCLSSEWRTARQALENNGAQTPQIRLGIILQGHDYFGRLVQAQTVNSKITATTNGIKKSSKGNWTPRRRSGFSASEQTSHPTHEVEGKQDNLKKCIQV